MDLKAQRTKIIEQVQRNKQDIINHEKHLEGLRNGAVYLNGQLNLIDELLKADEADKAPKEDAVKKDAANLPANPLKKEAAPEKEGKNENVASDIQPPTVPTNVAKSARKVRNAGSTTGNNSPS